MSPAAGHPSALAAALDAADSPAPAWWGSEGLSVAIYDDHVLARTGLAALLAGTALDIVAAAPLEDVLEHPAAVEPDVFVLAAAGPGAGLARRLVGERGARVLLMLEAPAETDSLIPLTTGVAGAVCRECPPHRLLAAIRAAAGGEGLSSCTHQLAADTAGGGMPLLSERERRIAAELARGRQAEDIATLLCISPHTVRTHVRNIRRKLGARNSAHAVALAIASQAAGAPASLCTAPA